LSGSSFFTLGVPTRGRRRRGVSGCRDGYDRRCPPDRLSSHAL
jgi:hypothetical protein